MYAPVCNHEMIPFILDTNKRIKQETFLYLKHFNDICFGFFWRSAFQEKGKPQSEPFSLSSLALLFCLAVFLIGWTLLAL